MALFVKTRVTYADKEGMDLSKVLDDVYDASNKQAAPSGPAPAWADDQRLDEVFSQWTPGPPADAPAAEREIVDALDHETAGAIAEILAPGTPDPAPVSFPAVELEPDPVAEALYVEPEPLAEPRKWVRGDDDIQFGGRSGGKGRRGFGRRR
jgi:hypothetical protein